MICLRTNRIDVAKWGKAIVPLRECFFSIFFPTATLTLHIMFFLLNHWLVLISAVVLLFEMFEKD